MCHLQLTEITLFNCYLHVVKFIIKADRPYAVSKLILILFANLQMKEGYKRTSNGFRAHLLLKHICFLAPWYLSDYSMFVGSGVYEVVDMLYVNSIDFLLIFYDFWFLSHNFTNST
jgi:hypothetical protein